MHTVIGTFGNVSDVVPANRLLPCKADAVVRRLGASLGGQVRAWRVKTAQETSEKAAFNRQSRPNRPQESIKSLSSTQQLRRVPLISELFRPSQTTTSRPKQLLAWAYFC